jgi:hypothetical protein
MPRRNRTPKHEPFHFVSGCQTKRRFLNEKLALAAAEIQELSDMSLELSVYKCDRCDGWHLTRQNAAR